MSYNRNFEEINCIIGKKNMHALSGNSHLSTLAPQLTPHHGAESCLLQWGTQIQVPAIVAADIFALGKQICSSAPSCSQVKPCWVLWHVLCCPTASHWKLRAPRSTRFVRGTKGSSVVGGEWRWLMVLPSERIQHKTLSPETPRWTCDCHRADHCLDYGAPGHVSQKAMHMCYVHMCLQNYAHKYISIFSKEKPELRPTKISLEPRSF